MVSGVRWLVDPSAGAVADALHVVMPDLSSPSVVVRHKPGGEDPLWWSSSAVVDGRFVAKFAWSGQAARRVAHEIGVLTALSSGTDVPFLPEIVASSLDPVMLVTRRVAGRPCSRSSTPSTGTAPPDNWQPSWRRCTIRPPAATCRRPWGDCPTQNRRPHPSCCGPDSAGGCAPISSEP